MEQLLAAAGENGDRGWTVWAEMLALPVCATELKPMTVQEFDRYIRETEERLADSKIFLWADVSADRARRVKAGGGVVEPFRDKPLTQVSHGLVRESGGSRFFPG